MFLTCALLAQWMNARRDIAAQRRNANAGLYIEEIAAAKLTRRAVQACAGGPFANGKRYGALAIVGNVVSTRGRSFLIAAGAGTLSIGSLWAFVTKGPVQSPRQLHSVCGDAGACS